MADHISAVMGAGGVLFHLPWLGVYWLLRGLLRREGGRENSL